MNKFLKMGTDAEYFIETGEGKIGSAIGLIGGSKEKPFEVAWGNLQEDNVLAEFAIDPVDTINNWLSSIALVTNTLRNKLRQKGFGLVCKSSHRYTPEELHSFDKSAMEMGCSPDYNIYEACENTKPSPYTTLRTAAAHIHFSYESPDITKTVQIIEALDYCLGVWSVLKDVDKERRELYGKAGSCRIKPYGGEYRTLGNFWLLSVAMQEYVYEITEMCVARPAELLVSLSVVADKTELQRVINECDTEAAMLLYPLINDIIGEHRAKLFA